MDDRRMDAVQSRINRVSDRAQDLASDAGEQLSQLRGSMVPYMDQARRFVQDRPLQAIALTIGLGFVLGKLLGGGRE
jgi:ElaB/YqjD/DUF883 family membrane-anchored ribosome-binding protein